jgi:mRNA-degrading endonuclease RelE of RelBE toxin-antitoxin system
MTHQSNERETPWRVDFGGKAEKQANKLPSDMRDLLFYLKYRMENEGPEQTEWRNYGKIVNAKDVHHCHLNGGRPRYVVVWKVIDWEEQIIEIRFAGTHGSVDYSRFK